MELDMVLYLSTEDTADGLSNAPAVGALLSAVDAHYHIWDPQHNPWLKEKAGQLDKPGFLNFSPIARPYSNVEHLADLHGCGLEVKKGVFVQCHWGLTGDHVDESRHMQAVADANARGLPQAIIGYADLDKPDLVAAQFREHLKVRNFRGVRFMLDWDPDRPGLRQTSSPGWMSDRQGFLKGLAEMQAAGPGLVFDLQVCQCQLREAAQMAKSYPAITFSLNHAGFPIGGGQDQALLAEWKEGIQALASAPNAVCKIGALCNYDAVLGFGKWTPQAVELYTSACLAAFGPERCMWESNLPTDLLVGDPRQRAQAFLAAIQPLNEADKAMVLRGTAERVYRI